MTQVDHTHTPTFMPSGINCYMSVSEFHEHGPGGPRVDGLRRHHPTISGAHFQKHSAIK